MFGDHGQGISPLNSFSSHLFSRWKTFFVFKHVYSTLLRVLISCFSCFLPFALFSFYVFFFVLPRHPLFSRNCFFMLPQKHFAISLCFQCVILFFAYTPYFHFHFYPLSLLSSLFFSLLFLFYFLLLFFSLFFSFCLLFSGVLSFFFVAFFFFAFSLHIFYKRQRSVFLSFFIAFCKPFFQFFSFCLLQLCLSFFMFHYPLFFRPNFVLKETLFCFSLIRLLIFILCLRQFFNLLELF